MTRHLLLLAATATLASAVAAQGRLPDRPIRRAEVIAGVARQFAAMDTNHDGVVSFDEFQAYRARNAGAAASTDPFAHVGGHWFEHADAKGDGRVTLAEAQARPLEAFDAADTNHDGVIDASERRMAEMFLSLHGK